MEDSEKNFDEELKKQTNSKLEFIIKTVCHSKLEVTHIYAYLDHDHGLYIHLAPTEIFGKMRLQIMNIKENTIQAPFDEYFINFNVK
jgi:hypothetical protein